MLIPIPLTSIAVEITREDRPLRRGGITTQRRRISIRVIRNDDVYLFWSIYYWPLRHFDII